MTQKIKSLQAQLFFFSWFALISLGTLKMFRPFLGAIFLALIYSVSIYPLYKYIKKKSKLPGPMITTSLITVSFLALLIPTLIFISLVTTEALKLRHQIETMISLHNLETTVEHVNVFLADTPLDLQVDTADVRRNLQSIVRPIGIFTLNTLISLGNFSLGFFTNIFIFLITAFAVLPNMSSLRAYLKKLSPLEDEVDEIYLNRTNAIVLDMVKGTFVTALAQALTAGLFLWLGGVYNYLFILIFFMIIFGVMPIVGTALISIPTGIVLLLTGNLFGGVLIILGQLLVVSNVDNLIRPFLVSKEAHLHPALLILSLIGGLSMFGALGFIYGPALMVLFLTSLEIYSKHYSHKST